MTYQSMPECRQCLQPLNLSKSCFIYGEPVRLYELPSSTWFKIHFLSVAHASIVFCKICAVYAVFLEKAWKVFFLLLLQSETGLWASDKYSDVIVLFWQWLLPCQAMLEWFILQNYCMCFE